MPNLSLTIFINAIMLIKSWKSVEYSQCAIMKMSETSKMASQFQSPSLPLQLLSLLKQIAEFSLKYSETIYFQVHCQHRIKDNIYDWNEFIDKLFKLSIQVPFNDIINYNGEL